MNQWMCEFCFTDAVEIGIIAPGYSLILKDEKYHILGGQGHKDHEIYIFPVKPFVDPDPECIQNEGPIAEQSDKFIDLLFEVEQKFVLDPYYGYCFVRECMTEFDKYDGTFTSWLINKCGQLIEDYEKLNTQVV